MVDMILKNKFFLPLSENKISNVLDVGEARSLVWEKLCTPTYDQISSVITDLRGNLNQVLTEQKPYSRLVIAPCPDYIEALVPLFQIAFKEVVLIDQNKASQCWSGITIISSSDWSPIDTDLNFISTITDRIADIYRQFFSHSFCVHDLITRYCERSPSSKQKVESVVEGVGKYDNPVVYLSSTYMTTMKPTFDSLRKKGRQVVWIGSTQSGIGYGILGRDSIEADGAFSLLFPELLAVIKALSHFKMTILFCHESYIHPQWDMKLAYLSYLSGFLINCFFKSSNSFCQFIQLMYDPVKGAVSNMDYEEVALFSYKKMMKEADKIIFSSSSTMMSDLIANQNDIEKKNILNFYRYTYSVSEKVERKKEGIHLASISTMFDDFFEPSRAPAEHVVKSILDQKIHLHYYTKKSAYLDSFIDSLTTQQVQYFHIHDIILDPQKLVNELQQYHAGWAMGDVLAFYKIAASCRTREFQDLFQIFAPSTVATRSLVYAAAGLPVISHRSLIEYSHLFKESFHQMELSEVGYLGQAMREAEWSLLLEASKNKKNRYSIDNNIERLLSFIQ
ncbi:hypothetical protein [Marinomonas fungiae]|uniref:hypothetical protein n=1 Tax=Marinomonas fungiae TaxID=1137284 RepID=UPI003A8ECB19